MAPFTLLGSSGQQHPIHSEVILGRGENAAIKLEDSQASRQHATLYLDQGRLYVRDEDSANGTFVNERRITVPTPLEGGDRLRLGQTSFTIQAQHPASTSSISQEGGGRRWLPWAAAGCALLALCLVAFAAGAFLIPGLELGQRVSGLFGGGEYTLEQALAEEAVDEREELLAYLGQPDAFTISRLVVEGVPLRVESWRYYGFGIRVDFVDGEIAWTIDIEPVPEEAILPAWYNPLDFELGMSAAEVSALVVEASPAGMAPESIDTSEGSPDLVGTSLLAGDQIMVGLDPAGVVYIETLALFPEQEGG